MILKLGIMQHLIKPKRDGGKMRLLKRFQILLVFLMEICMLSGCNSMTTIDKDVDGETQEKTGTEIENHTEVLKQEGTEWFSSSEEIAELELPEDMLAYWLVLNSRQSFVSTDEGYQEFYWNEYNWCLGSPVGRHQAERFMIVDMNGDGANEIVLECTPESVQVLHYENGKVYSYQFVFRGMKRIRNNGIYEGSNGAASTSYHRLTALNKDGYTEETIAVMDDDYYEVEGIEVTYEEFCDYVQNIESVELARAIEFTEDMLDNCLLGDLSEEGLAVVKHAPQYEMTVSGTNDISGEKMAAYLAVMLSEEKFISVTDDSQEYYLNNYHLRQGSYDEEFQILYFSIVDMDQDGIYEVVLTSWDITQIMHYEEGQVYSYQFDYDEIGAIANDGVFVTGHSYNGNYRKIVSFEKDDCIIEAVDNHCSINDDRIRYYFFSEEAINQWSK